MGEGGWKRGRGVNSCLTEREVKGGQIAREGGGFILGDGGRDMTVLDYSGVLWRRSCRDEGVRERESAGESDIGGGSP